MKFKNCLLTAMALVIGTGIAANVYAAPHIGIADRDGIEYISWVEEQESDPLNVSNVEVYYEDTPFEGQYTTPIERFGRPTGDVTFLVPVYTKAYRVFEKRAESGKNLPMFPKNGVTPKNTSYDEYFQDTLPKIAGDWHELQYDANVCVDGVTAAQVRYDGYYTDTRTPGKNTSNEEYEVMMR